MTEDIGKISKVVLEIDEMISNLTRSIYTTITKLKKVCKEFEESNTKRVEEGFNIFKILSDKYYKEDFHTEIITALLQKEQKHNAGDQYLLEFIKLLGRFKEIDVRDFFNAIVEKKGNRESKLDILIRDETSKKAIIIESKIYDAKDMVRQLPRYKEYVERELKFTVIAIVYLSLDGKKRPSEIDWIEGDKKMIDNLLIKLAAYNEPNDLYSGWLKSCISITNDIDSLGVLRQYSKLIQNLTANFMNKQLLEAFYEKIIIKQEENFETYKTTLSIVSMMKELPNYLAARLVDRFINDYTPFDRLTCADAIVKFEGYKIANNSFKLYISIDNLNSLRYRFRFYDDDYQNNNIIYTQKIINKMNYTNNFAVCPTDNNELERVFRFPEEEDKIYDFIKEFKDKLKTLPNNLFEV